MRLTELKRMVDDLVDEVGGDAEVLLAYQESYPLQSHIRTVRTDPDGESPIVYIVEGRQHQSPYAPPALWES